MFKKRGAKVMAEKKYLIDNAELMAEWNWEKNNELKLDPKTLTLGSEKKTGWKCSKGHEWQASIINRNKGTGCPYCVSQKVLKGYNDLESLNPILAKEWHYEKNFPLLPSQIKSYSSKRMWWTCENGHVYDEIVSNRTRKGYGCPYCSNHKVW